MYDFLLKWQTAFLLLFVVAMVALVVTILIAASIGRPKSPKGGDKVNNE